METLGVDLRKRVKSLDASEKARTKKCKVKLSLTKKNKGRQEVATCRHDASKHVEGACSGDGSHGKVGIEETDGSCCG